MVTNSNIENMFNKKKYEILIRILILFIMVLFLILIAEPANAYERPEFTDGLTNKWHPGSYCIPCHYTLLSSEKATEISQGCKKSCHSLKPKNGRKYEVDMGLVSNIHEDKICIRCHIGSKDESSITASDFHRIMSNVACLDCHRSEDGTYVKPQKTRCSDCHDGGPHVVHGTKVESICEACHGEYGRKYLSTLEIPKALNITLMNATLNKQEEVKDEFPTLGQFVTRLIESFIKVKG